VITTLTGENDVQRQDAVRRLITAFLAEHSDMGLERLDGEDVSYERMQAAVQSLPFLDTRKLVVLRSPGANKEFAEKFEQFCTEVAETNDVILIEPKLDKRLSYYKQLKKQTDFQEYPTLDGAALAQYLGSYAKEQGGSLSGNDARLLIDRVGPQQLLLQHEIDKLISYTSTISPATIELLTERTPQSSIFELLDAAFAGNMRQAMALYREQRAARIEPQQIIAMIIWQLHLLALVKTGGNRGLESIAKDAKLSPFTLRKTQHLARRTSLARLKKLVTDLRVFDVRLKSEGINADEVVQYYLLQLSQ
jgi:DNA polymerase III delta subunit